MAGEIDIEQGRKRGLWELIKSPAGAAILGLAGLLSGLVLGVYGLVAERQGQLKVSLVSISSVFDLHQPVGGLDVSYEGKSLRSANKALWSLSLVISNNGNAGLRRSDFDERLPFSVEILGGEVVDKPTMASAIEYLKDGVRFNATRSALMFEPFILDPADSFQISLVVLSDQGVRPTIKTRGKIAGLRQIEVELPESAGTGPSLGSRIFGADAWWIQVVRAVAYGILLVFGFVLIALALVAIMSIGQGARDKSRRIARQRQLDGFKHESKIDQGEAISVLSKMYVDSGGDALTSLVRVRLTLDRRQRMARALAPVQLEAEELAVVCARRYPSFPGDRWLLKALKDKGFTEREGGVLVCWRRLKFDPPGMRTKTWTGYAAMPRRRRCWAGLRNPSELLIRTSLYQRM